ncbi:hypothetical protein ACKI2N_032645 [Cupriavidus sp. 30B13]|uniref:hypothetical protein n=1 Tax=Cupriavidus sp. 30B13 TaxID=3384241 RepID=UPI003B9143B9
MSSFQRDKVLIVTSVEELPSGRYRGYVTLTTGTEDTRHPCRNCRDDARDAHKDADDEVEYAYRHYRHYLFQRADLGAPLSATQN